MELKAKGQLMWAEHEMWIGECATEQCVELREIKKIKRNTSGEKSKQVCKLTGTGWLRRDVEKKRVVKSKCEEKENNKQYYERGGKIN